MFFYSYLLVKDTFFIHKNDLKFSFYIIYIPPKDNIKKKCEISDGTSAVWDSFVTRSPR